MDRVGVRELSRRTSEILRRVEKGETVEVTDHGRPVARLVPVTLTGLDLLEAQGRLIRGRGDLRDFLPLPLPPGAAPPSVLVEEGREK